MNRAPQAQPDIESESTSAGEASCGLVILTVPLSVNPGPLQTTSSQGAVVPLFRLPIVVSSDSWQAIGSSHALPFRSMSIQNLVCHNAIELIIDDQKLVEEMARVLSPGGILTLTVPHARGLGRFDALNAIRYVRDISRRSLPLADLSESGWRRHYHPSEIRHLLKEAGLSVQSISSCGGLSENLRIVRAVLAESTGNVPSGTDKPRWLIDPSLNPGHSVPKWLGSQLFIVASKPPGR